MEAQSREERRIEKMIRRTGRDIYKLRKTKVRLSGVPIEISSICIRVPYHNLYILIFQTASKGQLDVHAFKEKMAFFTNLRNDVPEVVNSTADNADKSAREEEDEEEEVCIRL